MEKLFLFMILAVRTSALLLLNPQADAQSASKSTPSSEASESPMAVVPACPVVSDPGKSTNALEIDYFPSRPEAAIKDPHSLTLRLVFDSPLTRDKDRTMAFERQEDGSWKALVSLVRQSYAIWYVSDDSTGQRDNNHGQYWDLVFCDGDGRKLNEGFRYQAEGYAGAIFSDDVKRPTDLGHAIAILDANIDVADDRSHLLVYDKWVFKFRRQSDGKSATPELVQEIEKGLAQHAGAVGYLHGTAQFLVNWEQAFPPALVEKAAALADQVVPRPRMMSDLERSRSENLKDPYARADALGRWLAKHPEDPDYGNYVRKERLEVFQDLADVGAAEDSFQDLAKRTPRDADLYATMASVYVRSAALGRRVDLDQALTLLDKAEAILEAVGSSSGASYAVTLYGDLDQERATLNFWRGRALFEQQRWRGSRELSGKISARAESVAAGMAGLYFSWPLKNSSRNGREPRAAILRRRSVRREASRSL